MGLLRLLFFLFAVPVSGWCQDLASIFVSTGASYNTTTNPAFASGFTSIAIQTGINTKIYSITTMDVSRSASSLRTGMAYVLWQGYGVTLLPHIDGGITTTPNVALSMGTVIVYDLGKVNRHLAKYSLVGVVRMLAVTTVTTKPVYEFGFGKSF